ncbi:hypothetical protein EVAR_80400_1 [Eumeta japonica]|uniref:Uncharacterized protein n=1 Tax=Eumeta variegata TaxID=151549 RepID=A0A4C1VIK4_EUMVA|nr:hypothetical protein EVAR_80400_1 [Eumeta japonica]
MATSKRDISTRDLKRTSQQSRYRKLIALSRDSQADIRFDLEKLVTTSKEPHGRHELRDLNERFSSLSWSRSISQARTCAYAEGLSRVLKRPQQNFIALTFLSF